MWSLFNRTLRRRSSAAREPESKTSEADAWMQATRRREFESMRAPARDSDRTLAMETRLWLLRLPPKLRPTTLADSYPRVVNRIARDWSDNFMLEVCFEDLMVDRRGGRRGFPKMALQEIKRLHHFNMRHRHLIEQRMLRESRRQPDPDPGLPVLDDTMMIEWEPTETIVVSNPNARR
jgi:hypothetical protein